MSTAQTAAPGAQIGFRAYLWQFKSGVVAVASAEAAGHAGFGLGDGSIALRPFENPDADTTRRLIAHPDATLLCLAASPDGEGFVSGGDDGRLMLTTVSGEGSELATVPRKWIEQLAVSEGGIVYGAGKRVGLLNARGEPVATFDDHPSTVTGLAFNPKGKRFAVSHYGGVSLWWAKAEQQTAKRLNWKSSHLAVTWSPDGKFVMTATQENEMHGWRLSDSADMRMSGYPNKPRSLSWSKDGRWLATSGAEVVVVWDCKGKGPMGTAPMELNRGAVVTAVAFHPRLGMVASGDVNGLIKLGRVNDETSIDMEQLGRAPVTALAWSRDGRYLIAGGEDGSAGILDFGQ